jgi:hypothetical protein
MGSKFYGRVEPGSPFHALTVAAVAKAAQETAANRQGYSHQVQGVRWHGCALGYDHDSGLWYYYTADLALKRPAQLRELEGHGFEIAYVELENGFSVVPGAYQGEYYNDAAFLDCEAVVDNRVDGKGNGLRQQIKVTGPVARYAEYYAAIRQHRVKPKRWFEPQPGLFISLLRFLRLVRH